MGCCKAEKFEGWCKEYPIAYTNTHGDEYCLFHAPKEHKGVSVENFNSTVNGLIEAASAADETVCNLSGTIFPGVFFFTHCNEPLSQIDFHMAIFCGDAIFKHATTFPINVNFVDVTFCGSANFEHVTFNDAWFQHIIFSGPADFSSTTFNGEADFSDCTFNNETNFSHATFNGEASFFHTTFNHVQFSRTTFKGLATFSKATFNNTAIFENDRGKIFQGGALFTEVQRVSSTIFFIEIDFSASPISFLETILANFRFDRCTWPRKEYSGLLTWLNNKPFKLLTSDDAEVFFDEIQAEFKDGFCGGWSKKWSHLNLLARYEMVEDLYRQMKEQYMERHNEAEASKWHYREKEMFRKKKLMRRYFPLSASNLYWAFSGYGERPVRAGVILLMQFLTIGVAMNSLGFKATNKAAIIKIIEGFSFSPDWAKIELVIQAIIEHALFVKDPTLTALTTLGSITLLLGTKVLIPVQAALLVFALRNKFQKY